MDIQAWQSKNDDARIADQLVLHDRFDALEANQNQLMKALGMSDDYFQYVSHISFHVTTIKRRERKQYIGNDGVSTQTPGTAT